MSLESASFIKGLVSTNPPGTDSLSEADDHLRLIKAVLLSQFSGFTDGIPITLTETMLNALGTSGIGATLPTATDCNALPAYTSVRQMIAPLSNTPPSGSQAGDVVTQYYQSAAVINQLYQQVNNGRLWTRHWVTSAWSAWAPLPLGPNQASRLDITAGAMLAVGAFGLGTTAESMNAPYNLDAAPDFTHVVGIMLGMGGTLPPGNVNGDIVFHLCYNVNVSQQVYFAYNTTMVWTRRKSSGTWSTWVPMTGLGVAQVWVNMLGSRVFGGSYTNTTGRPIEVSVTAASAAAGGVYMDAAVGGVLVARAQLAEFNGTTWAAMYNSFSFVVPAGHAYSVTASSTATLTLWAELR